MHLICTIMCTCKNVDIFLLRIFFIYFGNSVCCTSYSCTRLFILLPGILAVYHGSEKKRIMLSWRELSKIMLVSWLENWSCENWLCSWKPPTSTSLYVQYSTALTHHTILNLVLIWCPFVSWFIVDIHDNCLVLCYKDYTSWSILFYLGQSTAKVNPFDLVL